MAYDTDNIFAKILRGEAPCIKVYEDEHTLAFMDIMPQMDGHTLVIPKQEAETLYDLSETSALACMKTVQHVGKAVAKAMNFEGTTIFQHNGKAAGQTVPHFHFHILPGPIFGAKALKGHAVEFADTDELQAIADKIIACLD
ncbi:HIT family protein [Oceanospirillum beijerinckii]|uniref:HIT family protein n=1 Tax=Oceanospirillum beijerinckii TaxID=64976 RepID=UPI000411A869|nr:HIT family protein [Oceanospirillum beijerinckii]MAC48604.1 HIT family protein [Oceanospirillum sp.]